LRLPRAYAAELEDPIEEQLAELKSPKPSPSQPTAMESGLPSAKSTYTNEKYGISLKFPSNYTPKEGELGNEYTLGYLGPIPMKFTAPGGVRIVTVALPPNSYPETDFNTGFVTLSVNQHLTRDECEDFPDGLAGSGKPITKKFSGIEFHGSKQSEGGLGHQFGGFYYHGFSGGSCYELGDGIATSGYGAVDGMKKVDARQVFAILEEILQSVRIHAPKTDVVSRSPSIRSLLLSPLPERFSHQHLSPVVDLKRADVIRGGSGKLLWRSDDLRGQGESTGKSWICLRHSKTCCASQRLARS
jgi:hypothetical protein